MYLFFGLVLVLLLVANVYDVPELNLGRYFYLRGDDAAGDDGERQRLHSPDGATHQARYATTDPAGTSTTADEDDSKASKRSSSKKSDDKKRLTDDAM